jgi:hypothetical protein
MPQERIKRPEIGGRIRTISDAKSHCAALTRAAERADRETDVEVPGDDAARRPFISNGGREHLTCAFRRTYSPEPRATRNSFALF